jgi:hypothetical protein
MAYVSTSNAPVGRIFTRRGGFRLLSGVRNFFAMVGASTRVAQAVEARARPDARDLKTLGLDAAQFNLLEPR